jgi:serine/threonine-protein kinase
VAERHPNDPDHLAADIARHVDAVCRRFEAAWKQGPRPRIEDQLDAVAAPGRPALLAELIALERELRSAGGEHPHPAEYRARFPDHLREVAAAFDEPDATGFTPAGAGKVLETLAHSLGSVPRVLLPDTDPDDRGAAVIKPASGEMPSPNERGERYQLFGEIARGGMGAVLKGRDADLGRDLAVKVLLEQHAGKPDLARRFIEEAQIGGQLQHPGIVPVYELGTFGDRRPYFTMKLVKGRTLAALLGGRADPRDELPRFLGIFEQVAQTVAYAHARGVIHRDLKPSNVMVGGFGEVQVMDWGLAKVLREEGAADEPPGESPTVEVSVIRTVRSGSADDESQTGSVLGTPAYMAPEQAGGDVALVDRRADVFGLGSILCEILTGQPAYTGRSNHEVFRLALRGDTADAGARLEGCGADADLVVLAKECLAPEPADRPQDAGAVAGRITAYLAGVQEKLRAAERERAVAEARAEEERRRRRLQVGLAAAVLALTTVGGLRTAYYLQQKQARAELVARTLGEATTLRDLAVAHADDPARWQTALAAIRRVEDAVVSGGASGAETRGQLAALRDEVEAGRNAAERDRRLLDRLADIRSAKGHDFDGTVTDADYADAFQDAGIDVTALPPAEAGKRIKARPQATALALAAAIDDWAGVRRRWRDDLAGAKRLSEAASVSDPDPWREKLRVALDLTDRSARLTALQAAARSAPFDALSPVTLYLLAKGLENSGDAAAAETVFRAAQQRHPGDLWINDGLASVCEKRNRLDDAIRFYTAARAIRPQSAQGLAQLLGKMGELDEAIAVYQDVARLTDGGCLVNLGTLLRERGRKDEAEAFLEAGVAAGRELVRLRPGSFMAHFKLGYALKAQGKIDLAIAEYREAIRLKPDNFGPHNNLGVTLCDEKHDYAGAIAEFRATIRLKPDSDTAHRNLGLALFAQGKPDQAIGEFREAIRINPDLPETHYNLGNALKAQGKLDEAIAEYRAAIRLDPNQAGYHNNLGAMLCDGKHDYDGAIAEFRAAIRIGSDQPSFHRNLGFALKGQGKLDEAIAEYREAIRLDPADTSAHSSLGLALSAQGKHDEAIREFVAAIRARPGDARALGTLVTDLIAQNAPGDAEAVCREAIRVNPEDAVAHGNLGWALLERRQWEESVAASREALRLDPNLPWAHNNLGNALQAQGKLADAIAEYHAAIRLKPDYANPHNNLGNALKAQGKLDEAIAEYRAAIQFDPRYTTAHQNLGIALRKQGKLEDALAALRRAGALAAPGSSRARDVSSLIRQTQQMIAVAGRLPAVLKREDRPRDAAEVSAFRLLCLDQDRYAAAARLLGEVLAADPNLGDDRRNGHRYNAACYAALAGCGKSKDDPPLDEPARAALRQQSLGWLKAERDAWARQLEAGAPPDRAVVIKNLKHWQQDADLAGVRGDDALAKLPDEEQKAWRDMWSDVEGLLKKAEGDRP